MVAIGGINGWLHNPRANIFATRSCQDLIESSPNLNIGRELDSRGNASQALARRPSKNSASRKIGAGKHRRLASRQTFR